MKNFLAAASVATMALAASAQAQIQYDISNPSGTVRNFDPGYLGPVLNELGIPWETSIDASGVTSLKATRDGVVFYFIPTACLGPNNSGCVGGFMFALFGTAAPVNQQTINAFNMRNAFVTTGPLPNGYYVGRYDIADFGIARGNVESSVDSFFGMLASAQQEFATGGQTVSALGYADDLSAGILNEASGRSLGVDVGATQNHAGAFHLREVRAMPEKIRAFAASEDAVINEAHAAPKE